MKARFQPGVDRLVGFNQCPVEVKNNPADPLLQIIQDLLEVSKKMVGDLLFDAVSVQGLLGKDEIRFLSRAPVGETVTDEKNGIIFFSVVLDEFLFASPAKTALLL